MVDGWVVVGAEVMSVEEATLTLTFLIVSVLAVVGGGEAVGEAGIFP
jgi:hypothetical protein